MYDRIYIPGAAYVIRRVSPSSYLIVGPDGQAADVGAGGYECPAFCYTCGASACDHVHALSYWNDTTASALPTSTKAGRRLLNQTLGVAS